ncbi:MAG: aldose 1-epimerase family protein [Lentisphaeraceae bacterium]|nr:aldose 1-epimerase family protein [Lentisphaeraceae bacterium]
MIIESKSLLAEFSTKGAELISLQDQQGGQYIWQGESDHWPGRAPLMFPICGFLKDNYFYHEKHQYYMQVHGFAANSEFSVNSQSLNSISFELTHSTKSLQHYPFKFQFTVTYTLTGNGLIIDFKVTNLDSKRLYFSHGWHPGFALNWAPNDSIENYYLAFPKDESLNRVPVTVDGLLETTNSELPIAENKTYSLSNQSFEERAIVLKDYPHKSISLRHIHSPKSLDLSFEGFPHLTLWGQTGANFLCMEPWNGLGDYVDHNNNFKDKAGVIKLDKETTHNSQITLTVHN